VLEGRFLERTRLAVPPASCLYAKLGTALLWFQMLYAKLQQKTATKVATRDMKKLINTNVYTAVNKSYSIFYAH